MSKSHKPELHDADSLTPALWDLLRAYVELDDPKGKKLAAHLGIARSTVYKRTERIGEILGTHNLPAAVFRLIREGKLAPPDGTNNAGGGGGGNNLPDAENVVILRYASAQNLCIL